ncbi:unnamed protein product, partial [Bubo scandiacus]
AFLVFLNFPPGSKLIHLDTGKKFSTGKLHPCHAVNWLSPRNAPVGVLPCFEISIALHACGSGYVRSCNNIDSGKGKTNTKSWMHFKGSLLYPPPQPMCTRSWNSDR